MRVCCHVKGPNFLHPAFRPRRDVAYLAAEWSKIFQVPWEQFRHEIQHIAQRQRDRVKGIVWDTDKIEPGDLVIPTEDDDWLHPQIAHVLRSQVEAHASIDCWFWQTWKFSEEGVQRITHNYDCLASHAWIHRPGREQWKFGHIGANKGYKREDVLGWINYPEALHLWNNTPASVSAMLYRVVRPHKFRPLVEKAIRTHRHVLSSKPPGVLWALQAVKEQLELLERL